VSYAAPSFAAIAVSPFDVIFNDLTIRGFSLGNPDFAGQIPGAIMQASRWWRQAKLQFQWPRHIGWRKSAPQSPIRCEAEKFF
jgi:hypothetical protein